MKHVMTLNQANLVESAKKGGKTSCTVANQKCEKEEN